MLQRLRLRNPGRPLASVLFFAFCQSLCHLTLTVCFRYRCWGRDRVPARGPLLVVSNHQSHLDPVLVGLVPRTRQCWFVARSSLFGRGGGAGGGAGGAGRTGGFGVAAIFGALIRSLNAIPLRQGEPDSAAMRAAVDALRAGRALLVFPEGARTPDGQLGTFKRGAWLLLRQSKATVLPVAVEGAYDAWPRRRSLPLLWRRRVAAIAGEPIPAERLLAMGDQAGLAYLARTVEELRVELRARLERDGARLTTTPAPPQAVLSS